MKACKSKEIVERLIKETPRLDVTPTVLFIQPPNDPRSASYIKSKQNRLADFGIDSETILLPENITNDKMNQLVDTINKYDIPTLIQLPLPDGVDDSVVKKLKAGIDIDALGDEANAVLANDPEHAILPATVRAIMEYLKSFGCIDETKPFKHRLGGVTITVVGRGPLIGRPLVRILSDMGATVVCCNSNTNTDDLYYYINSSDVTVLATGKSELVKGHLIEYDRIIIDAGVSVINCKISGDLLPFLDNTEDGITYTPCIGGVGPLTVCSVALNTIELISRLPQSTQQMICNKFYVNSIIGGLKQWIQDLKN